MDPLFAALGRRLAIPLSVLGATVVAGTVAFKWVWREVGGTWLDAVFMTITTITTIGYGEVKPLDSSGRIVAMAVALCGIGSLFYAFGVVMEHLSSDEVAAARKRRRRLKQMEAFERHMIVAGFGRVGRQAVDALIETGAKVVVIDPRASVEEAVQGSGASFLPGDATSDAVLERAGIRRAKGLIVTADNDATNLYVVLTARLLNPEVFIVSRAVDPQTEPKLLRAGANRAVSPYAIGGRRMAHVMVSPRVVDFFETALRRGTESLSIGEFRVSAQQGGRELGQLGLAATGANVLTVIREGEALTAAPPLGLREGDHLLALGTEEQLARVEEVLGGNG